VSPSSASNLTGPVTRFNELDLAGEKPDIDAYCAQYPDIPDLRDRLVRMKRLRADLQAASDFSPRASLGPSSEIGGYRLLRLLGEGGMGRVFVAKRDNEPGYCAIKVVDVTNSTKLERFKREAHLAASLDHPNLGRIAGWGTEGEVAYIASELVHGFTIRELMKTAQKHGHDVPAGWLLYALERLALGSPAHVSVRREGPIGAVVRMVRQVAEALGYAHSKGVVHRDVKPSNIMITFDGDAKLIDFGISLPISGALTRITRAGSFLGTIDYASPEQLRGELDSMGPWTDVFGLGATLFEMLTLRTPFEGQSFRQRLDSAHSAPPLVATSLNALVPMSLSAIIRHALDPLPQRRFQDGLQLAEVLTPQRRQTVRGGVILSPPPPTRTDDMALPLNRTTHLGGSPQDKVFKAVFGALRTRRDFVSGDGYLIGAIAPHKASVEFGTLLTRRTAPVAAAVIGQHMNAQIHLEGDDAVASRHLLAWLTVEGEQRRVRLLDLNTGAGFFLDGFGQCESVVSDGPLIVRVGSYHVVFLPTDDRFWPADVGAAWKALPPNVCLDTRDVGGVRSRPSAMPPNDLPDSRTTRIVVLPKPTEYLATSGPVVAESELAGVITLIGPEKAGRFPLSRAQLARGVLLGQDTRCDVATQLFKRPEAVSRVHAMLTVEDGRAFVFDLASTNGTLLDGKPIVAAELPRTARIELGQGNLIEWQARAR
jgi:serine/threonine protein kinase